MIIREFVKGSHYMYHVILKKNDNDTCPSAG